jgi:hypothetical protein
MKYVLDSNIALKWVLTEADSDKARLLRSEFQTVPGSPGLVARVDVGGVRTLGRFIGREFQSVPCP